MTSQGSSSSQSSTTLLERSEEALSESSSVSSDSPESSDEDVVAITPNENLPVGEIPQPDGAPGANQDYEAGKITLSLNDAQEIVVSDDTAKTTILQYVDSMKESSYNAENTPPAMGGNSVMVAVHRNNGIEQYIFTEVSADGNSLGKDLQGDTFVWKTTDSNALPYLLDLFS